MLRMFQLQIKWEQRLRDAAEAAALKAANKARSLPGFPEQR